jgi:hypothetical protein
MARYMQGQIIEGKGGKQYRFLGGDDTSPSSFEEVPPVKPVTLPTMGQSMEEELAGRPMHERLLAGGLGAFDKAAYGVKKLFTDLTPQEQNRLDAGKGTTATTAGKVGDVTTNLALSYPMFAKGVPAAMGLAKSPLGQQALGILGAGAIGGGYGAVTNPENRVAGGVAGGLGAATGQAIGAGLTGPFAPVAGSSAAALRKEGVPLTIGQSQGGGALSWEDSLRGSSRSVAKRQGESIEKWSQNQVNKVMPPEATSVSGQPIQARVGGTGRDAIAEGAQKYDDVYDAAYAKAGKIQLDPPTQQGLDAIVQRNQGGLLIKSDMDALTEHVQRAKAEFGTGELSGRAIKTLVRSFDKPAQDAYNSGNERLGSAYRAIQKEINDSLGRQFPDAASAIAPIDKKYAEFLRVQRAAGKPGAEDGVFSPDQLKQSIRDLDKSADKRAFARGHTVPDLLKQAEQAKEVLGPRLPPVGPGTAEKAIPALVGQNLGAAIPGALALGAYRPPVQNFMTGANSWQQGIDPAWMAAIASALANRR